MKPKCGDQALSALVNIITNIKQAMKVMHHLLATPRKAKISLYFAPGDEREQLLQQFGKHTTGKACVYINKLDDVDEDILKALIQQTIDFVQKPIQMLNFKKAAY